MQAPLTSDQSGTGVASRAADPLSEVVFVAFDTETTGLSPETGRLVELSGVKFRRSGEILQTFSSLINPRQPIPPAATAIHGITDDMVTGAPACHEAVPAFFAWVNDRQDQAPEDAGGPVLVAHNAAFDMAFLEMSLARAGLAFPSNVVIDTLSMARRLCRGARNHQLCTLAEHLGVAATIYHRALADSMSVKEIFIKLLDLVPRCTMERLTSLAGRLQFSRRQKRRRLDHPVFRCLQEALDGGRRVVIRYGGTSTAFRLVTPRAVLFTRGSYYLEAFCHQAHEARTFRIDRISSMEIFMED